uniref:Ricin B-type lectin domain-containing protein n=1 Tax=Elaeophora elaphi TaxID=1147741 RepID=A0A0R3RH79_9BILA
SESGKGVWVVKSRTLATTVSPVPQASFPAAETKVLSVDNKQQSQQSPKSENIICVEDKSARDGDPCSVSSICLQQEQGQLSLNYLQCDQSTNHWLKKSCFDGRMFSFVHQACISTNVSALKQSRLGTQKIQNFLTTNKSCTKVIVRCLSSRDKHDAMFHWIMYDYVPSLSNLSSYHLERSFVPQCFSMEKHSSSGSLRSGKL